MSNIISTRPHGALKHTPSIAFAISMFNHDLVDSMATYAAQELLSLDSNIKIDRFSAPGSFELPLIVQTLAHRKTYDAILALGIILRGETRHADLIAATVTDALMKISLENAVPVIHQVLLLESREQAQARCLEPSLNRGIEAARTALHIIQSLQHITQS